MTGTTVPPAAQARATGIASLLAAALVVGACAAPPAAPATGPTASPPGAPPTGSGATLPGTVLSVTPVAELDRAGVTATLQRAGLSTARVVSGVQAARLEYATVTPDGAPTRASALVVVPRTAGSVPVRTVSWQHGTTAFRGGTASMSDGSDRSAAMMFAAAGHLVSAPDYLGLGTGPGRHPYSHTASAVTASLDALRAARSWAASGGRVLDDQALLAGFSQGGPVSMALGHAVDGGALPGVRLGGLAAIDGPYDFAGTLAEALTGTVPHATAYLAYLTVAWNRLYHLYDRPDQAFRPPYDAAEQLLDGEHRTDEIMAGLPQSVPELFTPGFLDRLRHPDGALRAALDREGTSCDWAPSVPVALYHARGDRDVPFASTDHCRAALTARGATAIVHDTGDVDHSTSAELALPQVLDDFVR